MKLLLTLILAAALFSLSQAVVISWEESLEGRVDYRFFYLTMPAESGGVYAKPYFGLVDGIEADEYGALGSLYCPTTGISVAVYYDQDADSDNEWRCLGINILPFAGQPQTVQPPICSLGTPSGTPTLWNSTEGAWTCGPYNQVLTHATREGLDEACASADFLMYYGDWEEIRCVNPMDIDPSLTLQTKRDVQLEERVDVNNDKKWLTIMSGIEATTSTSRFWNFFKWTPSMNYDTTSTSSSVSTPPQALPFASSLIAATYASFKVSSYTFVILPPTPSDSFVGVIHKLSTSLGETQVGPGLSFTSISATSGQVTYGFSGLATANANPGEAFVGSVTQRSWSALPLASERHLITITLWIQTSESFTDIWPLP